MWVFEFFFQVWLYIEFLFWRGRGGTGKFLLPVPPLPPTGGAEGGYRKEHKLGNTNKSKFLIIPTSLFKQIEYLNPKLIYNNIKFKYGNIRKYWKFLLIWSKVDVWMIKVDLKTQLCVNIRVVFVWKLKQGWDNLLLWNKNKEFFIADDTDQNC